MRTNIGMDDKLMQDAMRVSGRKTKRAVVDAALRLLIQTKAQAGIRRLRGQIAWRGDLDDSRADRVSAEKWAVLIVDTTVWVDYLKGSETPETEWLDRADSRVSAWA